MPTHLSDESGNVRQVPAPLATQAQMEAGSATTEVAVTPERVKQAIAALATGNVAAASTTTQGKVELATNAEARTGTDTARAVTPAALRNVLTGLKALSFDGRNGAGAITLTGAVVGDKVLAVFGLTEGALGGALASFEATITVVDQIQQSDVANLSANNYVALLLAVA